MKSPLYIWCTYYGETLYEESSVYMEYILFLQTTTCSLVVDHT